MKETRQTVEVMVDLTPHSWGYAWKNHCS